MKKALLSLVFSALAAIVFGQTTHPVGFSGFTFTPDTVECEVGDIIQFNLSASHNAVEVSQATFMANGSTSNGGFSVPFGGGSTTMNSAGTFYYVCTLHASSGMKGVIIVSNANSVKETGAAFTASVFPTRIDDFMQVRIASANNATATVRVFNMIGAEMSTTVLQLSPGETTSRISLAHLQTGAYFVRVEMNGFSRTFKVVR